MNNSKTSYKFEEDQKECEGRFGVGICDYNLKR